jgi:hypothetical protein
MKGVRGTRGEVVLVACGERKKGGRGERGCGDRSF